MKIKILIISFIIIICGCNSYHNFTIIKYQSHLNSNQYRVDSLGFLDGEIFYLNENNQLEKIEFSHGFFKSYSRKVLYSNGSLKKEIGESYSLNNPIKYIDLRFSNYHLNIETKFSNDISYERNYSIKGKLRSININLNDSLDRHYNFIFFKNQDSIIKYAHIYGRDIDTTFWFNKEKKIKKCINSICNNELEEVEDQYFECEYQKIQVSKDSMKRLNFKYLYNLLDRINSLKPLNADKNYEISPVLPEIEHNSLPTPPKSNPESKRNNNTP